MEDLIVLNAKFNVLLVQVQKFVTVAQLIPIEVEKNVPVLRDFLKMPITFVNNVNRFVKLVKMKNFVYHAMKVNIEKVILVLA